jgi:predicted ATP-dependent endonuclease of OLD family
LKIESIDIHDFRCFKDVSIKLGSKVTVIAGHNATGKSTILALLGHCAELKVSAGRPILQKQFRTELSEIIKASPEFDERCSCAYTINFYEDDVEDEKVSFRVGWWDDGKRFRMIPRKSTRRNKEKKIEWPTLYLGLSRLYPVGESELELKSGHAIPDEIIKDIYQDYKTILSLRDEPVDHAKLILKGTAKQTVGIKTERYDAIANSAGQDNLGQILLAVMSFKKLKKEMGESWKGGLLLIDEVDATLHPIAQIRLLDYLNSYAKSLGIQVVCTTHSLSLLEYVCSKTAHNKTDEINNYELVYLTTHNEYLEVLKQPDYEDIRYDMLVMSGYTPNSRKITVYLEDDEARWVFSKLCRDYLFRLHLPQISLGWEEYLSLYVQDYQHFKDVIFVVDGDISDKKIEDKLGGIDASNIIRLPGNKSPEQILYEFLNNLDGRSDLYLELSAVGITKRYIQERGPDSYNRLAVQRERNKQWFKDHKDMLENVYPYWEKENIDIVESFRQKFVETFNKVSQRAAVKKTKYTPLSNI